MRFGEFSDGRLLGTLIRSCEQGLRYSMQSGELMRPSGSRLGFRELGLSLGLHGAELMEQAELSRFVPIAAEIESFWLRPEHQASPTWVEHRDINEVMLASSLVPEGVLVLAP